MQKQGAWLVLALLAGCSGDADIYTLYRSSPIDAYFGPSWTLVSVRAGHARRLDFDTVLGRSGQLRFGHLDDAGPPSRRDVVKFKACLLVGRPARRGSNLI